jgi:DNA polymerase
MTRTPAAEDLAMRIRSCTLCTLAVGRTSVVVSSGPSRAELMLIGEAPGAVEDTAGLPFVGRAGQLLDRLLGECGVHRGSVAVTNVVKCRPPGNRTPTRQEVASCRPWLSAQLELVAPRVVVSLGLTATAWFLGKGVRLAQVRGRAHPVLGHTLVPTYHPSAALRFGPAGAPVAALRADLAYAVSLL